MSSHHTFHCILLSPSSAGSGSNARMPLPGQSLLSNTDASGEYEGEEDEKKKEKKIKKVVRCLQIVRILGRLQAYNLK